MLIKTFAAALQSIDALTVTIEVNCSPGVYYQLVGLPDTAVKESYDRIVSAIDSADYKFPGKHIVINMSPADIKKEGTAYDLPLAVGILAADEAIPHELLGRYMMMGELGLDGTLRPVKGALPIAIKALQDGFEGLIIPEKNAREAAVVEGLKVLPAQNLREVLDFLSGRAEITPLIVDTRAEFDSAREFFDLDFSDVKGQENVKRALEVAAAGGHNILMVGAPGSGKSMMAKRMPGILPPFTLKESLETTKIYSVCGKLGANTTLLTRRPYRSPHHSVSSVALVGGGTNPQPGEISLAHNGVLFMDELPEFNRNVLEVLRQPLEERSVTISRAKFSVDYPAGFMLVAAMNPCPCGYYNHPSHACVCSPQQVQKYLSRVSGPLLDRIDIQVEIVPVPFDKLSDVKPAESSEAIRRRVVTARAIQNERFRHEPHVHCNAQMTPKLMHKYAQPEEKGMKRLEKAMDKLGLSARAYDRILKVARTIADLDGSEHIGAGHIAEAITYRSLDRQSWGTLTQGAP